MKKTIKRVTAFIMSFVIILSANSLCAYAFTFPEKDLSDASFEDMCLHKGTYKGMNIYGYYQKYDDGYIRVSNGKEGKVTPKNRKGIPHKSSCGVYAPCIAASAITGQKILPNIVIGTKLKRSDVHNVGVRYNTVEEVVAKRLRSYLREYYNYELSYKVIAPEKAVDYLDRGYFTVVLMHADSRFTNWRHWMLLLGHDKETDGILVANTNRIHQFMKYYDWNTEIKRYLRKTVFKGQVANGVAYRWKFDDTAEKTEVKKVELLEDTKVYEHIYGKNNSKHAGYFATISKGKKYKVVGVKGDYYKIKAKTVDRYYFIQKNAVNPINAN